MTRQEADARKAAGLPIESYNELYFALMDVRQRVVEGSPLWYFMNRTLRTMEDETSPRSDAFLTPAEAFVIALEECQAYAKSATTQQAQTAAMQIAVRIAQRAKR
jgi:hypothetical protein